MSDFNHPQNQPLRASRDDVAGPGPQPREKRPAPRGKLFSTGNLLTLVLAVVLLFSLGLIWRQAGQIEELTRRFDELNNLIKSTDESLSESGTALRIKIREQEETLDTHWSEIKKLWGVSYDRNRKAIAENAEAAKQAAATANQAKSAADNLKQQVSGSQGKFEKLDKEIAELSTTVKSLSTSSLGVSLQLEEIESRLAKLQELQDKLNGLSGRVADNESALKALDVYRSQVNQQLHQLRQQASGAP